eukprot:TRINITY_DN3098_c0_g4_i14.p1 TRINITY_DN3098_c0_g4~~TRINITY_DN3098_c0_g4_i14.p1  ORF type:complete len:223 (+),score=39.72 TRINITY_DN3098_c0_g4_i14:998-1666(+)
MGDNEAVVISGAMQYSTYKGYGKRMRWVSEFNNTTPMNSDLGCLDNHIVAVDAHPSAETQFQQAQMYREILKLYAGLSGDPSTGHKNKVYATGHWGCGIFGGNKELKAVQQIISCSMAGYSIVYSTFNDREFEQVFDKFVDFLQSHSEHLTVSHLTKALFSYDKRRGVISHVINWLLEQIVVLDPKTMNVAENPEDKYIKIARTDDSGVTVVWEDRKIYSAY